MSNRLPGHPCSSGSFFRLVQVVCLIACWLLILPAKAGPGPTNPPGNNEPGGRLITASSAKYDEYFAAPNSTQIKSRISFARAVPDPQSARILISQVKVQTWLEHGEPDLIIETPECTYDSKGKVIYSPNALAFRTADERFSIEGEGFTLFQTNSLLIISNRVHTVVQPGLVSSSGKPTDLGLPKRVDVFANRFQYSHESGLGTYQGNVRVSGTNLAMTCGSAEVLVSMALKALQSIKAIDNVVMDYQMEDREIRNIQVKGDEVLYSATNGITTVTGHPTWTADQRSGSGKELVLDATNKTFRVNGNAVLKLPTQSLGESTFLPQAPGAHSAATEEGTNRFVQVTCDHYVFETNFASFGDPVQVVQTVKDEPVGSLTCARLFLYFSSTNQVQTMLAEQDVLIQQGTNQFKSEKAVYTGTNQVLELTGNPSWRSGRSSGKGDLLQMNMRSQEMQVITNATMRLPASQLGQSFAPGTSLSLTDKPAATDSVIDRFADISAERYSLRTNSALFTGGVRIVHPRMDWACQRMALDSGSADGKDVRITAERAVEFHFVDEQDKSIHGTCEKAVYTYNVSSGITNDFAVLTGHPVIKTAEGTITGTMTNKIIIVDRGAHKIRAPGQYKMYGQLAGPGTNALQKLRNPAKPAKP